VDFERDGHISFEKSDLAMSSKLENGNVRHCREVTIYRKNRLHVRWCVWLGLFFRERAIVVSDGYGGFSKHLNPAPCPSRKRLRGQPKQRNEQHSLIPSIQTERQAVERGLEWSWDSVLSGVAVGLGLRDSDYHSLRGAVLDTCKARVAADS
jgi:hypothetical protein